MCRPNRSGFTLVELLIVMSILVVAAVIVIPFISSSNDRDLVPRAARFLHGGVLQARSRAQLEGAPCGIRLLPNKSFGGLPWYDQYQYVYVRSFIVEQEVRESQGGFQDG